MLRRFDDYGMPVVLLLLCAFFSVLTIRDQQPNDAAAAQELARQISRSVAAGARVMIATRDLLELLEKVIDRHRDAGNVVFQIVLKNS